MAEQARSLDRIHRLSNEQELGFGSILFWIFSSYQVKIQQYGGIKFGKDVANEIKFSKTETAVIQSEGTVFSLKEEMES